MPRRTNSIFTLPPLVFSLMLSCTTIAQDEAISSEENTQGTEALPAESAQVAETASASANKTLSTRYQCELQGLTRRVEVDYESSESSIPCSVNYYKDTEAPGELNTLWTATNIDGYCEDKAEGFVAKLKSWGWSCTDG